MTDKGMTKLRKYVLNSDLSDYAVSENTVYKYAVEELKDAEMEEVGIVKRGDTYFVADSNKVMNWFKTFLPLREQYSEVTGDTPREAFRAGSGKIYRFIDFSEKFQPSICHARKISKDFKAIVDIQRMNGRSESEALKVAREHMGLFKLRIRGQENFLFDVDVFRDYYMEVEFNEKKIDWK